MRLFAIQKYNIESKYHEEQALLFINRYEKIIQPQLAIMQMQAYFGAVLSR
jgi:hypothetical protein